MRALHRRRLALTISLSVIAVVTVLGIWRAWQHRPRQRVEGRAPVKPEAPPDLAKLRDRFVAALDAIHRNDGATAAQTLGSFDFGTRAVEEYRLYYLAKAQQLSKRNDLARITLARLLARDPQMVLADDASANLSQLYAESGDWVHAGELHATTGAARWATVEARFNHGDLAGAFYAARNIAIKEPASPQAAYGLAFARQVSGIPKGGTLMLTPEERLERAVNLMRGNDPKTALAELTVLEPVAPKSIADAVKLNRGLCLYELHQYEEATKILDPLAGGAYEFAIPAIYHASKSYRALAASINPIVIKTVVQRQRVGTTKVRKGKRLIAKPKFANVKKNIQLVDLAKKTKRDEYDRLATQRLKDLLQVRAVAPEVRLEALNELATIAESKNQDDYLQELAHEIVALEPYQDPGLQHFWDKAWAAYVRGDYNGAKTLFRFISDTYGSPNVKRQSDYWYARTIERLGAKEEAAAIYARLASAPYEDIYATYAETHGAKWQMPPVNPLKANRPDWSEIAEKNMQQELRLAYELTALTDAHDALLEIRKNAGRQNQQFANALLADYYNTAGSLEPMYRTLRMAFPQLATVEQDSVPPYFLKLYYPIHYADAIKKNASRNGLDPYLVMALILQESYFNPHAKSPVGAIGLMQVMPATGKELGRQLHGIFSVTRLTDPTTNIEIGTVYLKHLFALFGGEARLVIASYNAGQGNVAKWRRAAPRKPMDEFLESIPFAETRNYVKRVTLLRSSYARMAE
jgi:soluble lytic murein transglycosylase-like protein